jgi:hypothetical protein
MPISLKCHGCKSTLKVRDELAGKKVKCPRCQTVLVVPEEEEVVAAVEADEEEEEARPKPRPRTGKTGRFQAGEPAPRRNQGIRTTRRTEEEEEEEEEERPREARRKDRRGGKGGKGGKDYKPCPQCGAEGATRVKWTAWGSFYGPAMFTHVCCPECGYCYNGKTGRSNMVPAIVFVTVPLVGILGIIGAIVYMLVQRNYLKF